jgi:hypothetical protein
MVAVWVPGGNVTVQAPGARWPDPPKKTRLNVPARHPAPLALDAPPVTVTVTRAEPTGSSAAVKDASQVDGCDAPAPFCPIATDSGSVE